MTAFAAALRAIFADPNMADRALYFAGGEGGGVPVPVISQSPDPETDFNGGRFVTDATVIDVLVSVCPALARGDHFQIDDKRFEVFADPVQDGAQLVWKAKARAV